MASSGDNQENGIAEVEHEMLVSKAQAFDSCLDKLKECGIQVDNFTNHDAAVFLQDLLVSGPEAVAARLAGELIALKIQVSEQVRALQADFDAARQKMYAENETVLEHLQSQVRYLQTQDANIPYSMRSFLTDIQNHVDSKSYVYSPPDVWNDAKVTWIGDQSKRVIRWLGMQIMKLQREENWSSL